MSIEGVKTHPPGTAPIKNEFLKTDHVRELNKNFVAHKDKVTSNSESGNNGEPPKKKLKGQNRHRPRGKRIPQSMKFCLSFGSQGVCPYGDKCCYSHDIDTYLSSKPSDISDFCYLYETYGKCPFSFSCRFASKHIVDGKNEVKEELWDSCKNQKLVSNNLSKDIQVALRKRRYDFSKSMKALEALNCKSMVDKNEPKSINIVEKTESTSVTDCESVDKLQGCNVESKILSPSLNEQTEGESISCKLTSNDLEKNAPNDLHRVSSTCTTHEIKKLDFRGKLYLAPLTTVGNLPFRRICKEFGADITCGEMAMALSLLQGHQSEWALLKRHHTEDIFGVQLCGAHPDSMTKCAQLLTDTVSIDFIDINMGCPLEMVYTKGAGCGLMNRLKKFDDIVAGMTSVMNIPLTVKMRAGVYAHENSAHNVIKRINKWGDRVSLISVHGRSREQRYTKLANWSYINECAGVAHPIPLFGSGDIMSYEDYNLRIQETKVSGALIARGALIKPWVFKEIKEQKHWDISSNERMDILKSYTNYGLEHWGSDSEGVERTRRFLLEWLSFLYRYIPLGILERIPQNINERPPPYFGRNDLETLMASPSCSDWVKISEMLLGPVPDNFVFLPKHKANAYQ